MRAGPLKYRLTLLKPLYITNAFGEESVSYVATSTVHAERVRFTGRRHEEVGEHFPDYSAEFNIRAAHHVKENWRCQQLGGALFTITNIIPNIDKGYNTLICVRVNE